MTLIDEKGKKYLKLRKKDDVMSRKLIFLSVVLVFTGLYAGLEDFEEHIPDDVRCLPSWFYTGEVFATVDKTCALCPEERAYVAARQPSVDKAVMDLIGVDLSESGTDCIPRIAICCSGGSYRAMTASLGFLEAVDDIGLLDATRHVATLSGSSWMMVHYLLRRALMGVDIADFKEILKDRVKRHLMDSDWFDKEAMKEELWRILGERFSLEVGDLWGALLTNRLFGDLPGSQRLTFSILRDLFTRGDYKMPFVAFPLVISDVYPYEWLEVNPFIVSCDYFGCSIPTEIFDSAFKNGECYRLYEEMSLGRFMGLFGSAFNLSLADFLMLLSKELDEEWIYKWFKKIIDKLNLYQNRLFSSPVNNFVYGMEGVPLDDEKHFEVTDAGMDFNLPFPLLLRDGRFPDVVVVCDSGLWVEDQKFHSLTYAREYAVSKGLKFPSLDKPMMFDDHMFIFIDEGDPEAPSIIYFSNPTDIPSYVFGFTPEKFDQVSGAMYDLVASHTGLIADVIREKAQSMVLNR